MTQTSQNTTASKEEEKKPAVLTYGLLYTYHREIEEWKRHKSIMWEFFKGKIQEFYSQHGIRLNTFFDSLKKLQEEHMEFEGQNYKTREETYTDANNQEQKRQVIVFKEGKTEDMFKEKYADLCNTPVGSKIKIFDTMAALK